MLGLLAQWVMRGRRQAMTLVVLCAVLPLPFLSWVGASALALVTLRFGPREGGALLVASGVPCALVALVLAQPGLLLQHIVLLYLPVWGMAWLLQRSVSLVLTLQALAAVAAAVVVGIYLLYPELEQWWAVTLQGLLDALAQQGATDIALLESLLPSMVRMATGAQAALAVFLVTGCLLAGRAMQAQLVNPGGLRQEWHALRCQPSYALLMALMMLAASFEWAFASSALLPLTLPLLIAGLGLVHAGAARTRQPGMWLVGFYLLMVLSGFSLVLTCVLMLAMLDSWLDLRPRLGMVSD